MTPILLRAGAIIIACLVALDAKSMSYTLDPPNYDPDGPCHGPRLVDQEGLYKLRAAAVFSVLITSGGKLEPKGTATLVDDENGLFVTAAHVVHFYKESPIWVSQRIRGQERYRRYQVEVFPSGAATDDWATADLVVLQAKNWDRPPTLSPFPFRIDAVDEFIKGFYIGHAEDQDSSIFGEFNAAFGDGRPGSTITFSGTAFPHGSGALLLDGQGRAFALLVRDAEIQAASVGALTTMQLRRILWNSDHFSAMPLRLALKKIKAIPPSSGARALLNSLNNDGPGDAFLFGLRRGQITSIDTIHLIDAILSDRVWRQLQVDVQADLLNSMYPVVVRACTHRYWAEALARMYRSSSLSISGTKVADRETRIQRSSPSASIWTRPMSSFGRDELSILLGKLNERQPDEWTRSMGMFFLQASVRERERRPELSAVHARFAKEFLQQIVRREGILSALVSGVQRREHAALMGNLALAQELMGERTLSRETILVADALGGSVTAYQLAAKYALDEGDVIAATALHARAYKMLSADDAQTQALRDAIGEQFARLLALDPGHTLPSSPATYSIPLATTPNVARWYDLASGNVGATASELAVRLFEEGKDYEAEMLLSKALFVNEKIFGRDHPQIAIDLQNMAAVYIPQQRYERAHQFVDRALTINRAVFGSNSREAAVSLHNQGVLYRQQKRYERAEQAFLEALTIDRALLGQRHAQVSIDLQYIGSIYALQEEYPKAEEFYREALGLVLLSDDTVEVAAICLYNLGMILAAQKRFAEAVLFLSQALEIDKRVNGMEWVVADIRALALLHHKNGDLERAKAFADNLRELRPSEFVRSTTSIFGQRVIIDSLGGRRVIIDGSGQRVFDKSDEPPLSAEEWLNAHRNSSLSLELRRPAVLRGAAALEGGRSRLYPFR
jgi:tetratricopeptide (TPR) repeat protein